MNCSDVRAALPEFVYGAASPHVSRELEQHLELCPDCRREAEALGQVRRLLNAATAPEGRVDLAAVYRQAAERQARRLRLWRRLAMTAAAAAVLVASLTALSRLEVHVSSTEMLVRWGSPPAVPSNPQPDSEPVEAPHPPADAGRAPAADLAAIEDRLRTLGELTQALADDDRDRDYQRQQEIARLRDEIRQWQGASAERLTVMQKDFDALYVAHFANRKGVNP